MGRPPVNPRGTDGPKSAATRVHSVDRAVRLLHLIASTPEHERTVKELAAKMGTSLPSMYHMVNTLVDARMLTRDGRRLYHLGLGIGTLANAYYQQSQPPPELLDPLGAIIKATGETAYLSGLVRGELEVLAEMAGTRAVRVSDIKPGYRGAAHARASGKVLLAFSDREERNRYLGAHPLQALTPHTITDTTQLLAELDQVRQQGYATEMEEFTEGVACCAVPVLDEGILLAAFTLAAPVERYRTLKDEYVSVLKAAAESVALPQGETGGTA
jgi:IclR family transcriptional regulator, acetate operon repressor